MSETYLHHRSRMDYIFIMIIVFSPFAFYLHLLAPNDEKVWNVLLFTIDSGYFEYVKYYLWIYSYKLLILSFLVVWFLTCKHIWRISLLIPVSFEIYKLVSFINERYQLFNDYSFLDGLPFIVLTVIILIWLRKRLISKSNNRSGLFDINFEIYNLARAKKSFSYFEIKSLSKDYESLKDQKNNLDQKNYLIRLIELNDKLS